VYFSVTIKLIDTIKHEENYIDEGVKSFKVEDNKREDKTILYY
jgi:hypothetical protein